MNSDVQVDKSFDFASEVVKQLITLATGIVTLTISFSSDVLSLAAGNGRWLLVAGWILFLISILAGIASLMALTGQLGTPGTPSVYAGPVKKLVLGQMVLFLLGIGFMIVYLVFGLTQDVVIPTPS